MNPEAKRMTVVRIGFLCCLVGLGAVHWGLALTTLGIFLIATARDL